MTDKERKLALYCLKANSDYHSEVCEECINYPNCDHTGQDDVTETIIKALEQEPKAKAFDILRFVADNAGLSTFEAIEKAYNMGLSEQEHVLDKIRERIEHEKLGYPPSAGYYKAIMKCLQIINKYKTESEGKV